LAVVLETALDPNPTSPLEMTEIWVYTVPAGE
jgi:hypothetical protein